MSDLTVVTKDSSGSGDQTVTAECVAEDSFAIGGGASVSGADEGSVAILETRPTGLADEVPGGWIGSAVQIGPTGSWTLTVYAICAKVN